MFYKENLIKKLIYVFIFGLIPFLVCFFGIYMVSGNLEEINPSEFVTFMKFSYIFYMFSIFFGAKKALKKWKEPSEPWYFLLSKLLLGFSFVVLGIHPFLTPETLIFGLMSYFLLPPALAVSLKRRLDFKGLDSK